MSNPEPRHEMTNPEPGYKVAARQVIQDWESHGHKDSFAGQADDGTGNRVHVQVYHHETFPEGGRIFTIDVRPAEGSPGLLERMKISLVDGQVTRL